MNRLSASFIAGFVCLSAVAQEAVSPNGKISLALKDNGYVINYLDKAVLDIPVVGFGGVQSQTLTFSQRLSADYQMLAPYVLTAFKCRLSDAGRQTSALH